MNAFAKAFGPKEAAKSVMEGESKQTPADDMAMRMLKMLIPGFDPSVITKLGTQVETMVEHFNTELAAIKKNQEEILLLIKERTNDDR